MYNAKRNPAYLKVDEDELFLKGSTCTLVYINKIVAIKAPKTDVYHIKFYTKAVMLDDGKGFYRVDSDVFEYKKGYFDAEPLFKVNGHRCYDGIYLGMLMNLLRVQRLIGLNSASIHKEYMVFRRLLGISSWYLDDLIAKTMQLRNFPLLEDLPFSEIQLLQLYGFTAESRSSMLGAIYDKLMQGDTVGAVDMCFLGYKYPKSVKKVMLQLGFMNHYQSYKLVDEAVKVAGVDKVLSYIRKQDGSPNIKVFGDTLYLSSLIMGFTGYPHIHEKKASNTDEHIEWHDRHILRDAVYMMKDMIRLGIDLNLASTNYRKAHDELARINSLEAGQYKGAQAQAFKTVDTSSQYEVMHHNGFIVRSPTTAYELVDISTIMRNCISSYVSRYYYKQLEIVILTNSNGDYLACVEIINNEIVQAKIRLNRSLKQKPEYNEVIELFAGKHKLKIITYDMLNPSSPLEFIPDDNGKPRDSDRVEIINKLKADIAEDPNASNNAIDNHGSMFPEHGGFFN